MSTHPLFHDIHLKLSRSAQLSNIKISQHIVQILNEIQVSGIFLIMIFHGKAFGVLSINNPIRPVGLCSKSR
jgi:hypothetical protein